MKLVRVIGRHASITNDDRESLINAEMIVGVYEPSGTAYLGLDLTNGQVIYVSHAEWRRILRAAGATMPPTRPSPKPRKP